LTFSDKKKRGGARTGAGRKKRETPAKIDARSTEGQNRASRIIAALNQEPNPKKPDSYEIKKFRAIDDASVGDSLDLRKWLYDKADGKAVQTINHLHDKPIEVNATLSLGEGMRIAMEKAEQRLGGKRN
jgi:hypothetical protein